MTTPNSTTKATATPRWYLAYFFLAFFDIVTVSGSLLLTHNLMDIFRSSVVVNQVWADRINQLTQLRQLASQTNAPGNDVFDSLNPAAERKRMNTSLAAFNTQLANINADLRLAAKMAVNDTERTEILAISGRVSEVDLTMRAMISQADEIFAYFAAGEAAQAGSHMATMDRNFALLNNAISSVGNGMHAEQQRYLDNQSTLATSRQQFEYAIAAFILLMVIGATLYGHRIHREMRRVGQERIEYQAQLEASATRIGAILDNTADCIITLDEHGIVRSINRAGERIFGYPADEIIGRSSELLLFDSVGASGQERATCLMVTNGRELVGQRKNGTSFPLKFAANEVRVGAERLFISLIRDITSQKEHERAMAAARDAALDASRTKSQFLANMSHEIRTPMNGIIGMLELLKDTELAQSQRRLVSTANDSALVLLTIINDILDFSKMEAGMMALESVDLDARLIVENSCALFASTAQAKGVELSCYVPPHHNTNVVGDPTRLSQIMSNLLSNAVKFTQHGEIAVELHVQALPSSLAQVRITVRDTGIGISADGQKRLFSEFTQADGSMARRFGGTGLGLSIAKRLVELMGGHIDLHSEIGRGTTFVVEVSLLQQAHHPAAETIRDEWRGLRVLVVDDNPSYRMILDHYLRGWNMKPTLVEDGNAAITALRDAAQKGEPYPLVLIDLRMSAMDGLQLAERIEADNALVSTRRVLLRTVNMPEPNPQTSRCIHSTVCKPLRQSELFDAVAEAIGRPPPKPIKETQYLPIEGLSGKHVLLVEDNVINQMVAQGILDNMGIHVTIANHGREALERLSETTFDLVLMDCQMPEMDGFEATAAIREREHEIKKPRTTIIALTANAMSGDRDQCLAAGMDDYLTKPLRSRELQATLIRWLTPSI